VAKTADKNWDKKMPFDKIDSATESIPHSDDEAYIRDQKHRALRFILDAWEEAVCDGVEPDMLATAAMFAALSDMVTAYGEEPVATMTDRLAERIRMGEFTVNRTTQ